MNKQLHSKKKKKKIALANFNCCVKIIQEVFHEDAAAVAFTHAALWFLGENKWERCRLFIMIDCRCLFVASALCCGNGAGSEREKKNTTGIKRGNESLSWSVSLLCFFLGPSVACNWCDGN